MITFVFAIWLYLTFLRSLYHRLLTEDSIVILRSFMKMWIFYVLLCSLLYTVFLYKFFEREQVTWFMGALTVALFLSKLAFLTFRKKFSNIFRVTKKVAVLGSNLIDHATPFELFDGRYEYKVVRKIHEKDIKLKSIADDKSDIYWLHAEGVEEILCCLFAFEKDNMRQLIHEAEKYLIRLKFVPAIDNMLNRPISVSYYGRMPVITLVNEPLLNDYNSIVKRLFDVVFSSFVIVFIMSWLYPIIALLIKLESKGPVLFKQERSGMDNKSFWCLKFRSMRVNQDSDKVQATKNDSRITKIGAFLRKSSLDELPQFFNVFKGEMSVVGPRPHMLAHTMQYRKQVESFMVRHYVKPGITGLAQVSGFRGETKDISKMEKRVEFDIEYLQNWSFMLDLKIVFLTVWNIVKGEKNAY